MTILGNRILIQPTEPISQLPSGLFLPETAVQKPNLGKVVNVGDKADISLLNRTVMYNPILAVQIEDKHLISSLDIKFIL